MAIDLPAVVIEASAPREPRALGTLGSASRALSAWQEVSGLHAIDLPVTPALTTLAPDPTHAARVDAIELALRGARDLLDLGDRAELDDVRALLAFAYDQARAHPDDPEAPWLVAEVLRALARCEGLAGNAAFASELRARAAILDGDRMIGLSEGGDAAAPAAGAPAVTVRLELLGVPEGAVVRLDGVAHAASEATALLMSGEHHLRVSMPGSDGLDAALLFAQWFVVASEGEGAASPVVRVRIAPAATACSAADLAPALASSSVEGAQFSVQCGRWARVQRADHGSIEVRICGAHACGAPTVWLDPAAVSAQPDEVPAHTTSSGIWSSGWTYVALGAASLAAGSVVAWRLGAFDRPEAPPPTWRWEGVGR